MKYTMMAVAIAAVMMSGCATSDYAKYTEAQQQIQMAKSAAEAERYKAMATIAQSGDSVAKVAAMFALHGASNGNGQQQVMMAAPKDAWDSAREWLGLILPTAVQAYGINANKQVAIAQSNNSRDVAVSTNGTFATMGGHIAAGGTAVGTVAQAGLTAVQNTAQAGFTANTALGQNIENTATAGLTATQATAQSGLTATQTTATAGLTAVQTTAQSGLTAVQTTAANGITAVQGIATSAITNQPVVCSTDGTTVTCN